MSHRLFALTLFLAHLSACIAQDGAGALWGVVRDPAGKPLPGITLELTAHPPAQTPAQPPAQPRLPRTTTSDANGAYRFSALAAGDYELTATQTATPHASSTVVHIPSGSPNVHTDLTAARTANPPPAAPTATPTTATPPPQFQASGIRGLIDPGGYSASANAAAATSLVRGIADLERSGDRFGASPRDWPCSMQPLLQKALDAAPDDPTSNQRLGQFYVAHDQPAKALPLLQRSLRASSANSAASSGSSSGANSAADSVTSQALATALLESGQFDQARTLLLGLAERAPTPAARSTAHQLLARSYEGSGLFRDAAQHYRLAASEEPSVESSFGTGYELILSGAPADALAAFQSGAQIYPHSVLLSLGIGTAQLLLGHSAEALRTFLAAHALDPADPRPYGFLAALSVTTEADTQSLRAIFRQYLDHTPQSAPAHYFYALSLSRADGAPDTPSIESLLRQALHLDPNLARAHLLLADTLARRGAPAEAVEQYQAAVRLAPELSEAHYRLALAYKRAGRAEDSTREMQLFQQSNIRPDATPANADLAQFVSMFNVPDSSFTGANDATQCAPSP